MKINSPDFDSLFSADLNVLRGLFEKEGFELRIAGGAVHDLLIGDAPADIEFTTTATPTMMVDLFNRESVRIVHAKANGTVTCRIGKTDFEVTTLRIDEVCDGRRAQVAFTKDWELDANRRDLTINALFLDLDGTVVDYVGGVEDCEKRRVRFVGEASMRIQEDFLRILSYFRFFGKISPEGAAHDEKTIRAIVENKQGLEQVSPERIWTEMKRIVIGRQAPSVVKTMVDDCGMTSLLGLPSSSLSHMDRFTTVFERGIEKEKNHPGTKLEAMTLIAALCSEKRDLDEFLSKIKLSKAERTLGELIVERREEAKEKVKDGDPAPLTYWRGVLKEYFGFTSATKQTVSMGVQLAITVDAPDEVISGLLSSTRLPAFPVFGLALKPPACHVLSAPSLSSLPLFAIASPTALSVKTEDRKSDEIDRDNEDDREETRDQEEDVEEKEEPPAQCAIADSRHSNYPILTDVDGDASGADEIRDTVAGGGGGGSKALAAGSVAGTPDPNYNKTAVGRDALDPIMKFPAFPVFSGPSRSSPHLGTIAFPSPIALSIQKEDRKSDEIDRDREETRDQEEVVDEKDEPPAQCAIADSRHSNYPILTDVDGDACSADEILSRGGGRGSEAPKAPAEGGVIDPHNPNYQPMAGLNGHAFGADKKKPPTCPVLSAPSLSSLPLGAIASPTVLSIQKEDHNWDGIDRDTEDNREVTRVQDEDVDEKEEEYISADLENVSIRDDLHLNDEKSNRDDFDFQKMVGLGVFGAEKMKEQLESNQLITLLLDPHDADSQSLADDVGGDAFGEDEKIVMDVNGLDAVRDGRDDTEDEEERVEIGEGDGVDGGHQAPSEGGRERDGEDEMDADDTDEDEVRESEEETEEEEEPEIGQIRCLLCRRLVDYKISDTDTRNLTRHIERWHKKLAICTGCGTEYARKETGLPHLTKENEDGTMKCYGQMVDTLTPEEWDDLVFEAFPERARREAVARWRARPH